MGIAIVVPLLWLFPVHKPVFVGSQTRPSHTVTYGLVSWLSFDQRWREPPGQVIDPADPAWPDRHSMSTLRWNVHPGGIFLNTLLTILFVISLFAWRLFVREDAFARPCGVCGYDLRELKSAQCPECGTPLKQLTARHLILNMNARDGDILRLKFGWAIAGAIIWLVGGALVLYDMFKFVKASRAGTVTFDETSVWGTKIFLGMSLIWLMLAAALAVAKRRKKSQLE